MTIGAVHSVHLTSSAILDGIKFPRGLRQLAAHPASAAVRNSHPLDGKFPL